MKSQVPKQFIEIAGIPVIVHTIRKFLQASPHKRIIVTLPEEFMDSWSEIKSTYLPDVDIFLVKGGKNRFLSVKNALNAIAESDGFVAIHDAVRPFITEEVINHCYKSAVLTGSGVAAIGLRDSIREITGKGSMARERSHFRLMQTPQVFSLKKLRDIYNSAERDDFTDDASVWEYGGNEVKLIEGSALNIKITFPEDIPVAEAIYRFQADSSN